MRSGAGRLIEEALADLWQGVVLWDYPLSRLSTLKVGGPAKAVVFPGNAGELLKLIKGCKQIGIQWRVMGRGSNILVADQGVAGVVIVLGPDFSAIETVNESPETVLVRVNAGCSLAKLVSWSERQALSGLEFAAGIPGSIGGALVMNAGAWGSEISNVTTSITLLEQDGQIYERDRAALPFVYRSWGAPVGTIALNGTFRLVRGERVRIAGACREVLRQRREKQPLDLASAGSFFKNPVTMPAGRLIEEAGLKGCRIGNAMVSDKHANFIVNVGGATADEIKALMRLVQEKVFVRSGILLEPEVHIWDE
ncbi:MAG: UDP-N-acetylenolpyruvoylglucosamine reductase [Deltaproteobacteria bacterium RIFOXYD12_FULL_50_9]|nr:MAG: UDP-N-acetylenolpyruvoylglucosamine reductase [Deltaproteobacteria bacterium RIFOXYD12_FULL_50_9]